MKPEQEQLIDEMLGDDSRREITLLAGAKVLRRRRQVRVASRILPLLMVAALAIFWAGKAGQHYSKPAPVVVSSGSSENPAQIKSLSDEQLLALFPNTPVVLAQLPNGKKILIFPRAGDAAKYMGRL